MNLVVYSVFLLFCSFSESYKESNSWNPCPRVRSSFEGISVDSDGGKHPNCVCNEGYFGDKCNLKVYISGREKKQSASSLKGENSHRPDHDHDIFPLEFLRVHRYPNGSTIVLWQHVMVASVKYYTLHFRSVVDTLTTSPWRGLVHMRPEYFQSSPNLTKPLSYLINGFLNTSGYEINLAIVNNKAVLVSVSILIDPLQDTQPLRVDKLEAAWYSASLTWSDWSTWGKCETEKGCGRGIRRRSSILERERCISDKRYETRPCKLKSCPVNGGWSNWVSWTQCSVSCGHGTRSTSRSCSNPSPRHGGRICFGKKIIKKSCIKSPCPDSKGPQWRILTQFRNLDFTSVAIGASAGFISCLVMMICPRLLKRCKRTKKHGYKPLRSKPPPLLPSPPPPPPPPPPPQPQPPPPVFTKATKPKNTSANERGLWPRMPAGAKNNNWNTMPTSYERTQAEIANNIFINELMNAFRNFNVLETTENSRGKISDKIPQRNSRGKTIPPEKAPQ